MIDIAKIINQSPWLLDAAKIDEDIHLRRLKAFPLIHHEDNFLNYNFQDGVYIVTGPRQIGKTTHLKMLIKHLMTEANHKNFLYFNCDILDKKADIVEMVTAFLINFPAEKRRYVLLDEITAVKDSFLAIKFLIDNGYDQNITYIITGSNTINIKKTGEFLPGRRGKGIDFVFNPLSFKSFLTLQYPNLNINVNIDSPEIEFIKVKEKVNLAAALDVYLKTGGIPRIINEYYQHNYISAELCSVYRSWITSEVAKAEKKEHLIKMILERCVFSLGSEVSYNAFVQDTGIGSHNTISDYIDFLINAFVIGQIYYYDINQQQIKYRKNKKIYFSDPFVYAVIDAWLTGKPEQNYDYLEDRMVKSHFIENLIYLKCRIKDKEVYFYKGQREIDFVMSDSLLELKYQNKIVAEDYLYLNKYTRYKKILVTKDLYARRDGILMIPVEYFLVCDL